MALESNELTDVLADKTVLVTGGAAGIGEAVCKLFARHGANVVVNGLEGDPVEDVVQEILEEGGEAISSVGDVGTSSGAQACVNEAVHTFGKLDVLVANAGLFPRMAEVQDFPVERLEELIHSNILGTFYAVRAALPELQRTHGSVIAAGSEAALRGRPGAVCYGASKGWIMSFIRGVAAEQAKYGVRANVVAPGPIDTEMTQPGKGAMTEEAARTAVDSVPLGRRGTPEEAAQVYLFLASDLSSYVTGAVYTVDGGATAAVGLLGRQAKDKVKLLPKGKITLRHQHAGRGSLC